MKFDRSEGLQEESTAEVKEDFGTPPPPEKHYEALADISVYGMSLWGSSHAERCHARITVISALFRRRVC